MDNFRIIYRILRYLEKAMDYGEADIGMISSESLHITEQRWYAIMRMLSDRGYITGITVRWPENGGICVSESGIRITLDGLSYLQENSLAFCRAQRTLMRFTTDSLRSKSHILDYVSMVKGNPAKRAPLTHNPGSARWHTSRSKA